MTNLKISIILTNEHLLNWQENYAIIKDTDPINLKLFIRQLNKYLNLKYVHLNAVAKKMRKYAAAYKKIRSLSSVLLNAADTINDLQNL